MTTVGSGSGSGSAGAGGTDADAAFCAACGAALEPGAVFCGSCGARVERVAGVEPGGASGIGAASASAAGVGAGTGAGAVRPFGDATSVAPGAASARPLPAPQVQPRRTPTWSLGTDVDDAVAPVWRRLVALLVDQLLAVLVGGLGALAVLPSLRGDGSVGALLVPGLLLLLLAAGQWFAEAFAGRTVGGALLGTRTVSARTGRPAGLWAVLVRSVVQGLGGIVGGIGVYVVAGSGAWDEGPEQRGWHDKAAGTLVLRARPLPVGPDGRAPGATTGDVPGADSSAPDSSAPASPAPVPAAREGRPTTAPPAPRAPEPAPVRAPAAPLAAPAPSGPTLAGPPPEHAVRVARPAPVDPAPAVGAPELPASAPAVPVAGPAPDGPPTHAAEPVPTMLAGPAPVTPPALGPESDAAEPIAAEPTATEPERPASAPVPSEPERPAPAPLPAAPVDDLPDATIPTVPVLGDLEHTRVAGWGGAAPQDVPLVLVLETGARVEVGGPGLIGRRPVAGTASWTHLVTVEDPEQSVSSTHLEFRPVPGGLEVVDRGSTNGTVLVDPAGTPWTLPPAQPAHVTAGWTLVLGNHRIQVTTT
ncbi:RDD family protein [Cellulomonas sp. NPDC058312]|uniref:RDD family protein n=1 Tax=Cellulomonas sp. NPDC058312 TaxID=3346441 RepID=UPI0036E84765